MVLPAPSPYPEGCTQLNTCGVTQSLNRANSVCSEFGERSREEMTELIFKETKLPDNTIRVGRGRLLLQKEYLRLFQPFLAHLKSVKDEGNDSSIKQ